MRRQRFSREQIAEADQRDILGVARELNLKLEKEKIHIKYLDMVVCILHL